MSLVLKHHENYVYNFVDFCGRVFYNKETYRTHNDKKPDKSFGWGLGVL